MSDKLSVEIGRLGFYLHEDGPSVEPLVNKASYLEDELRIFKLRIKELEAEVQWLNNALAEKADDYNECVAICEKLHDENKQLKHDLIEQIKTNEKIGKLTKNIRIGCTNFRAGVPIETALCKAERDFELWESGEAERIKKRAEKTVFEVMSENEELKQRLEQYQIKPDRGLGNLLKFHNAKLRVGTYCDGGGRKVKLSIETNGAVRTLLIDYRDGIDNLAELTAEDINTDEES